LNPVRARRVSVQSVNPTGAVLTKVKVTERPVLGSVTDQQAPQEVELNPVTNWDPAIRGKVGRLPKVGKPLVMRPFSPVEQAVVCRLVGPTQ
jgi:hypothetical protein